MQKEPSRNLGGELLEQQLWRSRLGRAVLEEESGEKSWARDQAGGIKEEESWRRNLERGILEEESEKRTCTIRNHGGGAAE